MKTKKELAAEVVEELRKFGEEFGLTLEQTLEVMENMK